MEKKKGLEKKVKGKKKEKEKERKRKKEKLIPSYHTKEIRLFIVIIIFAGFSVT